MEYSNLEIARGLSRRGHAVCVAARWNPGIERLIARLDFRVSLLPGASFVPAHSLVPAGRWNWLFWSRYRSILLAEVKRFRPDVALIADETANAFWGSFGGGVSVPHVSYCSVPYVARKPTRPGRFGPISGIKARLEDRVAHGFRRWMLASYRNAGRVAVVSRSTRRLLAETAPDLGQKMKVVPRSVDDVFFAEPVSDAKIADLRREFGVRPSEIVLLTVTNLLREKGVDDAIHALAGLPAEKRSRFRFLVVGAGPDEGRLRRLALRLGVSGQMVFAGPRAHENLPAMYDLCDLFLLPSRRGEAESFGRVFAEAAARARPCVGVAAGGMPDVIADGESGHLISAGDRDALTRILLNLLDNRESFAEMGLRGRIRAEKRFSSGAVALEIERLLSAIPRSSKWS
jgi:glycosyltransferase involved in cell wall biosynthesis